MDEGMSSPTITLGHVDEHEGERVETDFRTLLGIVPLTPVGSYYRRSEDQRYPIALNTKSALKAVLSYHTLYLTIGVFALAVLNIQDPLGELFLFAGVVSALVCAFARFRLGKLTPAQERRRAIHLEVTGVSALPTMLPSELVKTLRGALERKWSKRAGKSSWRDALDQGEAAPEDLKLLAVLAAYDACTELDAEATARAESAWAALCEQEHLPLESLSPEEARRALQEEAPAPRIVKRKRSTNKHKRRKSSRGIKIRCERCEHVTRVPDVCAGQTGRCPSCERGVRVPSLESMRIRRAAA
jgi:ribosomal protein S27E